MSISVQQIEGKVVSKLITRNKKDIKVIMLEAFDGREILLRQDRDLNITLTDYLNQQVKITGVIDGSFFLPCEITLI